MQKRLYIQYYKEKRHQSATLTQNEIVERQSGKNTSSHDLFWTPGLKSWTSYKNLQDIDLESLPETDSHVGKSYATLSKNKFYISEKIDQNIITVSKTTHTQSSNISTPQFDTNTNMSITEAPSSFSSSDDASTSPSSCSFLCLLYINSSIKYFGYVLLLVSSRELDFDAKNIFCRYIKLSNSIS